MGCPDRYYTRALQRFAYFLSIDKVGYMAASAWLDETDEENLEKYILEVKSELSPVAFGFEGGFAAHAVLNGAMHEGVDQYNAALGGVNLFEEFVLLGEDAFS